MSIFTKSDLISYYQCPKSLWLKKHLPELAKDKPDEMIITNGESVGELARNLHPNGIHIDTLEPTEALNLTAQHKNSSAPIFEPIFEYDGVRVRVDILHGNILTEVKSGTKTKPHYITDAAIQAWVTSQSGQNVNKVQLAIVDSEFIYQGNSHDGALKFEDITDQVKKTYKHIPDLIENAKQTVSGAEPIIATGTQCNKPHACPFKAYCNATRPEYPIESLPRAGKAVGALRQEGIHAIGDIPEGRLTNAIHEKVRRTVISGKPEIDAELTTFIKELGYPRYYLDFEAIAFAVPIWAGTRPHQHLPFQWSCHIERKVDSLEHKEFLNISGNPPMRDFAESLIAAMGNAGPIIVYSPYEQRMIKTAQKLYPDLVEPLQKLTDRLVDLLPWMRDHYYHPQQHGSWSIKALLPIVAPELNYKDLNDVHNGTEAQMAFVKAIDPNIDEATKKQLELDMLIYCKLDTLAMVKLVGYLSY